VANDLSALMNAVLVGAADYIGKTLRFPRLVGRDYQDAAAANLGDTINVPIYPSQDATDVTPSHNQAAPPDITPVNTPIVLSVHKKAGFHLTDKQAGEIVRSGFLSQGIIVAADAIKRAVSTSLWGNYKRVYGYTGTAGTTPFASDITDAINLSQKLTDQYCPRENRKALMNTACEAKMLNLSPFKDASQSGDRDPIFEGQIGRKVGFDWGQDHDVPLHTAGTITTGLICKASTMVAVPANQKVAQTIVMHTAASTGACALKEGDIIEIAGQATGSTFTVTADATQASANSDVSVTIYPGINTALAGSEAVTVKASHRVNLGFRGEAFQMVSRIAASNLDAGAELLAIESFADPVTGLVYTLERVRQHFQTTWWMSVLMGSKCVHPELACRLAG
jgi:hypothetical protein